MPRSFDELDLSRRTRIDELCREYEDAWYNDTVPSVVSFVGRVAPEDIDDCLRELLATDFELRLLEQQEIPIAEMLSQFPSHSDLITRVFEEVIEESHRNIPRATDSLIGTQIGDYQLLRELGRGGMGIVYEALQVSLQRHVALKILPPSASHDPARVARFAREAHAVARLHHEHIVEVHGAGEANGTHYIAMQFIAGESLDRVLTKSDLRREFCESTFGSESDIHISHSDSTVLTAKKPPKSTTDFQSVTRRDINRSDGLEVRRTAEVNFALELGATHSERYQTIACIGQQMAEALSYAHSQGVLHRDVKPSNILLDNRGDAWLADFGLAKVAEANTALTESGNVIGTIKYLAPESLSGKTDHRSDIYSLGLTLYELLSGRSAFDSADRAELLNQILTTEPTELAKLVPSAPRDLVTIIHKSIERESSARYPTARELADDLQRFLNDEPIRARPISNLERFTRWARRNKLLSFLLLTTFALLSVGLIGSVIANFHFKKLEGQQRQLASEKGKLADEKTRLADDKTQLAERNAKLALEQTQLADRNAKLAEQNGNLAREAQAERDRSTLLLSDVLARQGLEAADSNKEREALVLFAGSAKKCQSLDAKRYRANVTRINAISREMGTLERVGSWGQGRWPLSYVMQSQAQAVVQRDRDMKHCALFDLTTGREIKIPQSASETGGSEIGGMAWSVDGQRLFVGGIGRVTSFRFPQLDEPQVIDNVASTPALVQWLVPDSSGRYLAIASGNQMRLWHTERREFLGPPVSQTHSIREFVFSSDSEWLISVNAGQQLQAFATKDFGQTEVAPTPKFVGTHYMNEFGARALPMFLRGNSVLLTFPQADQLELRDLSKPNQPRNLPHQLVYVAALTPLSDDLLFIGGVTGGVLLRVGESLNAVIEPIKETVGEVYSASFLPQRRELLVGYANRDTDRFQMPGFKRLPIQFTGPTGCSAIVPSSDFKTLLTSGLNDGYFCLWRLPTDTHPQPDVSDMSPNGVRRGAFSNDSRWLAVADGCLQIAIHDLATHQRVGLIPVATPRSPAGIIAPFFLPDEERLGGLIWLGRESRELRVWNWRTGELLQSVMFPTGDSEPYEWPLMLTSDRRQLFVSQGQLGTGLWFDLTAQKLVPQTIRGNKVFAFFGLSPNGHWIAGTQGERNVVLMPRQASSEAAPMTVFAAPFVEPKMQIDFKFSSDQQRIAASFRNTWVAVWDVPPSDSGTGPIKPLIELKHPQGLHYSEFSADNRHLLTVTRDATARVWELSSGRMLGSPITGSHDIGASFRPHHDELLTVDQTGRFDVWDWHSTVKLWPTRQVVRVPAPVWPNLRTLTLSPDGCFAIVGGIGELALIDLSPLDVTTLPSSTELTQQAQLLSGLRLLDNGGTTRIEQWLDLVKPEQRPLR